VNAIASALLAVVAKEDGDRVGADAHLSSARRSARTTARRDRQVVEIAALIVAGDRDRAVGLALEHAAEFPDDADLLARVAGPVGGPGVGVGNNGSSAPPSPPRPRSAT